MKKTFGLTLKLFAGFIATAVISFISMMLFLSAEISSMYKILFGIMFVAFTLIIAWNASVTCGEKDTKEGDYRPYRGAVASTLAMVPAIVLAVIFVFTAYNGWQKDNYASYEAYYLLLYLIFLPYAPLLSAFVSFNPALNIDFAQPAITYLQNITTPNAVAAPMFFIPIILFVLVSGIGYLYGNRERRLISDALKKLKTK